MNSLMLPERTADAGGSMAFTFGDPIPVLDRRELLDYLDGWAERFKAASGG